MRKQGTVIYLSHGGGPMPLLGDPGHLKMIEFMKILPSMLNKPDEILVISAHWEESVPTVIGSGNPDLYYDYYGFPEEAYDLDYPVSGNTALADTVHSLLSESGVESKITTERGFDHGLFVPLIMMYPAADIPVTQISLIRGLNPDDHLKLGKALAPLTDRNILIIGSGFSFHNMGAFSMTPGTKADPENNKFQEWLIDLTSGDHSSAEREHMLLNWSDAPGARYCHPREEHLMPLHVCYGIAGTAGDIIFDDYILGKRSVAVKW